MRRISFLVMLAAGVAIAASAFFPFATSSGGNIVLEGGNVPSDLGGIDTYLGMGAIAAGILVVIAAFLLRAERRVIGGLLGLVGAGAAIAAGAYALYDPEDFYARVGSALVGEGPEAVREIVTNFEIDVAAGAGAWIAVIGGGLALLSAIWLIVARESHAGAIPVVAQPLPTEVTTDPGPRSDGDDVTWH